MNVYEPATLEYEQKTVAQNSSLAFIAHDSRRVKRSLLAKTTDWLSVIGAYRKEKQSEFFSRPLFVLRAVYHSARSSDIGQHERKNPMLKRHPKKKKKSRLIWSILSGIKLKVQVRECFQFNILTQLWALLTYWVAPLGAFSQEVSWHRGKISECATWSTLYCIWKIFVHR